MRSRPSRRRSPPTTIPTGAAPGERTRGRSSRLRGRAGRPGRRRRTPHMTATRPKRPPQPGPPRRPAGPRPYTPRTEPSGRSADPAGAVLLADVTAEELVTEITGADQAAYDAQLKQLTGQVDAARARLNAIPAKNAPDQAAAKADVTAAEQALQQYKSTPA